jgi:hypothetical protein
MEAPWRSERPKPPSLLWSKGYGRYADVAGPESYWLAETESGQSESFFRTHYAGAKGVIWVRLSTQARDNRQSDLDTFVRVSLPTIQAPFALVTTDGDASVPSDLTAGTTNAILGSPWLVSWHTQNHDGFRHPKLFPIPIGLDLHSRASWRDSPQRRAAALLRIRSRRPPLVRQPLRIFTDLNRKQYTPERREAVGTLEGAAHVDFLRRRVSQGAIWRRFARYPFVLSAPGHGLDCHRTWEILYLGSIVITKTTSLDPLFEGLPVAIVEDWREARDLRNLRRWLDDLGPRTAQGSLWKRLAPGLYMDAIRQRLLGASGGLERESGILK